MPSAATLLVLVVASGEADPLPDALDRAAHYTLGASAAVVVRRVDSLPSDAQAQALGESAHAGAIAEVAWSDADHRRARLHVRASPDAPWVDREIGFASSDAPAEQGRTIGFALASMLPDVSPPPAGHPPDAPALPATPQEASPSTPPAAPRGELEALALAAQGLGGYGGGIGGGIGASWYIARPWVLHVGGAVRVAEVAPAAATAFVGSFGAGVGWRPIEPTQRWHAGVGVRVDALAIVQSLTHYDIDDNLPDRKSRWLPAVQGLVEGSWLFTSSGAIVVGIGGEAVFGSTDVYLSTRTVTTLPPFRALLTTGIRARF